MEEENKTIAMLLKGLSCGFIAYKHLANAMRASTRGHPDPDQVIDLTDMPGTKGRLRVTLSQCQRVLERVGFLDDPLPIAFVRGSDPLFDRPVPCCNMDGFMENVSVALTSFVHLF